MKKIIRSFIIFVVVLLTTAVLIPWNNTAQWGLDLPMLQTYELYIKAGIGVLMLIISLVGFFISNKEYKENRVVSRGTNNIAFLPIYMFLIAVVIYIGFIFYNIVYSYDPWALTLMKVSFFGLMALLLTIYGHILYDNYRKQCNGRRVAYLILILVLTGISSYFAFWMKTWGVTEVQYTNMNTSLLFYIPIGTVLLFVIHILMAIIFKNKSKELEEVNVDELNYQESKNKSKASADSATIVSPEQPILSNDTGVDPTNIVYEDVHVDPEFSRAKGSNKANSIEYYIDKPKMFKPLDPTFDQLVEYIRGLPQVVTKLDDDKITFYVNRNPFIVLMNFGSYYRMAFRYDLEKGIRLIIKYPTISKNKSTRDELWFKANNYGDLPKDVIFQIVKSSYDSISL